MKWLCCEGDPEGLSSQRPQIPCPQSDPLAKRQAQSAAFQPLHCGVGTSTWERAATSLCVCEVMTYKGQPPVGHDP